MLGDIIIVPVISEKATSLKTKDNKYVFKVRKDANKCEIKKIIEKTFNVKVLSVTTQRVTGKPRIWRGQRGRSPSWKKAIVKLREEDKLEFLEG
jgi:large subunit ribosomal protein L23